MACFYCGKPAYTSFLIKDIGRYEEVCPDCMREKRREFITEKLSSVKGPRDFSTWKKEDMSEAFWLHLIKYQKHPNKYSLSVMRTALLWAFHDDHGLSNSFTHAMEWCGIDLFKEIARDDLPDT